jgi:hypothetical protein
MHSLLCKDASHSCSWYWLGLAFYEIEQKTILAILKLKFQGIAKNVDENAWPCLLVYLGLNVPVRKSG